MKITTKLNLKYYRIMKRLVEIPTGYMFLPFFILLIIPGIITNDYFLLHYIGILVALAFFYFYIIFFGLGLIEREQRIKSNINECSIIGLLIYYIIESYVVYNFREKLKGIFNLDFGLGSTFLSIILLILFEYILFALPLALVFTMKYNRHLVKKEDWRFNQYYKGVFINSLYIFLTFLTLIIIYSELRFDLIRSNVVSVRESRLLNFINRII